ncbi:MAG: hypothetical protein IJJ33_09020 [Victivallales bacterium]|nr:hypothetical protein [Victivallales bacterium]
MVVDPDASYYIAHGANPKRQRSFSCDTRRKLNQTGFPFECYCLNDIPKIPNLDKIKMVVFPCQWEITPSKEALLKQYILKDHRMVIWLYAPGLSDGGSLDESRCEKWLGMPLNKAKGIELHAMSDWTSVFVRNPDDLTTADLKNLARQAGVHLYTEAEMPVFANSRFLAVHCKDKTLLNLTLPYGVCFGREIFSGKTVEPNQSVLSWQTNGPNTLLFELRQR